MMRTNDPVMDAERYSAEADDYINNCPVCDICGKPITDEYYYEVGGIIFHLDCAEFHSVDEYVEEKKGGYEE